jgi:hypothetical protein
MYHCLIMLVRVERFRFLNPFVDSHLSLCFAVEDLRMDAPITVVMLTYRRPAQAVRAVAHYCQDPLVRRVLVVANDANSVSEVQAGSRAMRDCDVLVWQTPRNSLNNRFLVADWIPTDAVLSGAYRGQTSNPGLTWRRWQWMTTF